MLPCCRAAALPRCRAAVLPCCRAAALPRCRAAVLPCCRAAALLRCRAAAQAYRQTTLWTCCCPGIQADTALDVLLPRHPGRHRAGRPRIALNLPHEFTRVRCDVSGSCLSKLFLRADHTLQRWPGRRSDRRRPVPAACSCSEKKHAKSVFAGLKKEIPKTECPRQSVLWTGCFSTVFKNDTLSADVRFLGSASLPTPL